MNLTLVATFNTKAEATHAVDALVEAGWDRKAVSTTVRRELGSRPTGTSQLAESETLRAIALVAIIGAVAGAAIGLMLALGNFGIQVEQFQNNIPAALIAGAIAGMAVGTYSGAVASVRTSRDQRFELLSPYLSAKERVMVSLSVPEERQEAVSRLLRQNGAHAVREWTLLSNETPHGLQV